jgi:hypothetical protein
MKARGTWLVVLLVIWLGCGGTHPAPTTGGELHGGSAAGSAAATPAADDSTYAPLDVGADYATYRKFTDAPFLSAAHGNRWVDVYVNAIGADAYLDTAKDIPVGTIVVKTSWIDDGSGRPSTNPGPIFIMEKRAPGYAPDHGDWYFAIHWATAPANFGGPMYWRGSSPKIAYCYDCHDGYDRDLGGLVPSSQLPR